MIPIESSILGCRSLRLTQRDVGRAADDRHRRAQFMRCVGHELPLRFVRVLQSLQQRIERRCERRELVVARRHRQPHGGLIVGSLIGLDRQARDGTQRRARRQPSPRGSGGDGDRDDGEQDRSNSAGMAPNGFERGRAEHKVVEFFVGVARDQTAPFAVSHADGFRYVDRLGRPVWQGVEAFPSRGQKLPVTIVNRDSNSGDTELAFRVRRGGLADLVPLYLRPPC